MIVVIMRRKFPEMNRPFKVPGGKIIPFLSVFICLILLINISLSAWIAYFIWILLGIIIYFVYARTHANSFNG